MRARRPDGTWDDLGPRLHDTFSDTPGLGLVTTERHSIDHNRGHDDHPYGYGLGHDGISQHAGVTTAHALRQEGR